MKPLSKKNRVWEVDFLRGLAILLVVWDHAMYDYARVFSDWRVSSGTFVHEIFSFATSYISGDLRFFWRPAFLFLFFFTSGLCTALSRNNLLRGLRLWAVACVVSIVTFVVEAITGELAFALFGVLHCLAVCILTFSLAQLFVKGICALVKKAGKVDPDLFGRWFLFALCLSLGAVFTAIHFTYNVTLADMTKRYAMVQTDSKILGLFVVDGKWWTADYFPLLPYIAFFYFGAAFSRLLYDKKRSLLPLVDGSWNKPFCFAGRHSLVVYLGGQVLAIFLGCIFNLIAFGTLF